MLPSTHRDICSPSIACLPSRRTGGYSVTELVIVISIMGVLAGMALQSMGQFLSGSKDALASTRQEMLNDGLYCFAQQNYELLFNSNDGSITDELFILRTLQYRNPALDLATVGSPYIDPRYNPVASSDNTQHRLRWTGRLFELLVPGVSGTGLLMDFNGVDFTTAFVFPPNFQMAGR
jgi:type II secretory pathway pseudopilin PulG